ncbi:putative ATP-dependent RNA helicase DHX34 [Apostichopus japonicus]|uniref:Putative ATP-dependent RNA helicase DHX34 n=1 Tax=Stichopus japonicus TaxID=307972 RepID=A0A2G8JEE9_STIJA|nr:putative ATP-dependent RNA helicase DHX34 [Apostichopus japonicus]
MPSHKSSRTRHREKNDRDADRYRRESKHYKHENRERSSRGDNNYKRWDDYRTTDRHNEDSKKKGGHSKQQSLHRDDEASTSKRLPTERKVLVEIERKPEEKAIVKREVGAKNKEKLLPFMFDWKRHKHELDKLFFESKECLIKRGGQEYRDFWIFLEKYLKFQAREQQKDISGQSDDKEDVDKTVFKLPKKYDKRYKINISLRYPPRELLDRMETPMMKLSKLVKLKTDQANLPIFKYNDMIVNAVKKHNVVLIAGDTGCGKSTQVPQYLMAAGFDKIACTQPRRIACISLAKRVGFETLNEYGDQVGYQIRFEAMKSSATKIIFLTEGLLLRQIQSDPHLSQYNVIVLDEVHERHLQGDFLLGILRCLLEQEPT